MPQSTLSSWFKAPNVSESPSQSNPDVKLTQTSKPQAPKPQTSIMPSIKPPPPITQPTNHDRNAPDKDTQDADTKMKAFQPTNTPASQSASFLRALHPTLPPLPAPISFSPMTEASMPAFQRLNAVLLPIPYKRDFYDEILADPVSNYITLLAFWDPSVVHTTTSSSSPPQIQVLEQEAEAETGHKKEEKTQTPSGTPLLPCPPRNATLTAALRGRIYPHPSTPPSPSANTPDPVLYISTLVLLPSYRHYGIATHLLATITARAAQRFGVTAVTAHVWEANEEGRAWYKARGFKEVERVEGYYARLRPSAAVVVRRGVGVGEWVEANAGS